MFSALCVAAIALVSGSEGAGLANVNTTRTSLSPTITSSPLSSATTTQSAFEKTLADLLAIQESSDNSLASSKGGPTEIDDVSKFIVNTTTVIQNATVAIVHELDQLETPIDPYYGEWYLGPIVDSVNSGLYTLIYNILGENVNIFDNSDAQALVDSINGLEDLSAQLGLDENEVVSLSRAKVQLEYLIASPYADAHTKDDDADIVERRATTQVDPPSFDELKNDLSLLGQDQDTLNQLLLSFEGQVAPDAVAAFINGTMIEIDQAISTVTSNKSQQAIINAKDQGNNVLGPFVQYVTVGTEILISNIIGSPDVTVVQDVDALAFSNALTRLTNSGLLNSVKYTTMENLEMVQRQFIDLTYANPQYTPTTHNNGTVTSSAPQRATRVGVAHPSK